MKNTFFTLLMLCVFQSLYGQQFSNTQENKDPYPQIQEILRNNRKRSVSERDQAPQLDSIKTFDTYNGLDSSLYNQNTIQYLGDTVKFTRVFIRDFNTGLVTENFQTTERYDALGRLVFREFSPVSNPWVILNRYYFYWKGTSETQLDSVKVFYKDNQSGVIYLSQLIKNIDYNAAGDEIYREYISYDVNGSSIYAGRNVAVYQPDGHLLKTVVMEGVSLNVLLPISQNEYQYSADTTIRVFSSFSNGTWLPNWKRISLAGVGTYDKQRHNYQFVDGLWNYIHRYDATFDDEGRPIVHQETQFSPNVSPFQSMRLVNYLVDDLILQEQNFNKNTPSGEFLLQQRTFYYYSPTSGTNVDVTIAPSVIVSPNPANSVFNVDAGAQFIRQIELYDVSGRSIRKEKVNEQSTYSVVRAGLLPGVYFLKIQTDMGVVTRRVQFL